ncbi:GIP [Symbiodinium sp. CCMP2456]|nr:GIP [Symbiodinium sp. CCMP2456]
MADSKDRAVVPTWDGAARSWRRYTREVAWWVQSVPVYKRRYCGAQLLSRLTGPARLLAMSWSTLVLDSKDGVKVLLQKLASSLLVRKSLPNAAAICQQYFSFRRNPSETIGNFLVRETLVHEEFVEAIIRLHEEKEGLTQDQRDFGLPRLDEEWDDEDWSGSWGWWNYDDGYEAPDAEDAPPDDSADREGPAEGDPEREGDGAAYHGAAPGSSPSHRSMADASPTARTAGGSPQVGTPPTAKTAVNEMTVADSFIMGVLQAAGLSAEEKRDILSSTKNSLDYDVVAAALQSLWDDQLLGHRGHGGAPHHLHFVDAQVPGQSEAFYVDHDDWAWNEPSWYEGYYAGEEAWDDSETRTTGGVLDDPKMKEAAKAEKIAESLAVDVDGGTTGDATAKGKGHGKKGAFYADYESPGKGKGKSKDSSGFRQVNAYSSDMFVGGLELSDAFEAATTELAKPEVRPQVGMLDSGATASAAPDAVVQGLISAVLSHDRNAKIELDQGARYHPKILAVHVA